jgi:hypothetical protein
LILGEGILLSLLKKKSQKLTKQHIKIDIRQAGEGAIILGEKGTPAVR